MAWTQSWGTILGTAAVVATLALTSAGVQLARAGDGDAPPAAGKVTESAAVEAKPDRTVSPSSDGPICPAAAIPIEEQADLVVLRLQRQVAEAVAAAAATAGGSSESDGMALNNRGHNYGATPLR